MQKSMKQTGIRHRLYRVGVKELLRQQSFKLQKSVDPKTSSAIGTIAYFFVASFSQEKYRAERLKR
jgi:hypothetical protein